MVTVPGPTISVSPCPNVGTSTITGSPDLGDFSAGATATTSSTGC
jgi:hypothetical protein